MKGLPVGKGCNVMITPGAASPSDPGMIVEIPQVAVMAGGQPLATSGAVCLMINSVTGALYRLTIGPLASAGVRIDGQALVRTGDSIPTPPGILTILGPPAAPFVNDQWPP